MIKDTPLVKRAYNLGLKVVPNFLNLSEEQVAYYEEHLDEIPNALVRGFVVPAMPAKFSLLVDLGIIEVPADYVHASRLEKFAKENKKKFYFYNDNITDKNFSNPSRILKPGDKFAVAAYKQIVSGSTTSEERMAFLKKQNTVLVGAQGASLVFEQKRNQLPKDLWYCSFDEKNRLWKDAGGRRGVPRVTAGSDGGFSFCLGCFEDGWGGSSALLCFRDLLK